MGTLRRTCLAIAVAVSALLPATAAPAFGTSPGGAATTVDIDRCVREFLDRLALEHDELDGFVGGSRGVVSTAADMGRYLIAQLGRLGANRTALLYNHNYALTDYQGLIDGVLALVQAEPPGSGRPEAGLLGESLAVLAALTLSLQVRGLLRLRRWAHHNQSWR